MKQLELERFEKPILTPDPDVGWRAGSVQNGNVILHDEGDYRYLMYYRGTNGRRWWQRGDYLSQIGRAFSKDGYDWDAELEPVIVPSKETELSLGCEDPNVTVIDGTCYIFYTSAHWPLGVPFDDKQDRLVMSRTTDFKNIKRDGQVGPPGLTSKAGGLFPRKIGGRYVMYWTANSDTPESTIMAAYPRSLGAAAIREAIAESWEKKGEHTVLSPLAGNCRGWELGAPAVEHADGWLVSICPPDMAPPGSPRADKSWTCGYVLTDLNDPTKIIAITPNPVLWPRTPAEKMGVAPNICMPSGLVLDGDRLFQIFGAADLEIHGAEGSVREVVNSMVDADWARRNLRLAA
jgi:predicted GH43/DUF377 family glycosyl hydrolase